MSSNHNNLLRALAEAPGDEADDVDFVPGQQQDPEDEDEDGAVSEDEVGELVATAGPRTARRLRRNGVVVAPGAEAGGAQQPVGRLDYSASVLSSGLKFSLGTMHTVFFLDHQITQQLMQMPIAQESTFIFATIFAVHGLTHVAKLWILYLIIGLFVARMGSPGCASPTTPRCPIRASHLRPPAVQVGRRRRCRRRPLSRAARPGR